jgi:ATP-dependent Lhr-like helicase
MKGELWRVLSVDEVVKVEPIAKEGEIPSWVGEEIPVPFEVAIAVGKLRREIAKLKDWESVKKFIERRFQTNENAIRTVFDVITRQKEEGYEIPSDTLITIEGSENVAVINCCFGHRVNETIGRIVALLLSARKGRNVGIEIDPYRIKLSPANCDEVTDILLSIHPDSIPELAERSLIDTNLLQWKIIHSARKFGYLRKESDMSRINLRKLVIKLKDTPIYEEAVREIFTEKLDIERAKDVIRRIGKSIRIVKYNSLSPISLESREQAFDLLSPTKPFSAILDMFKKRLENEIAVFHCLNCKYTVRSPVKLIDDLRCPKCGSNFIAVFNARRKIEDFSKKELYRIANLVLSHGRRAVLAMNTHGVGAENASRILSRYFRNDDEFYKELMEAEKRYIRTRGFWD